MGGGDEGPRAPRACCLAAAAIDHVSGPAAPLTEHYLTQTYLGAAFPMHPNTARLLQQDHISPGAPVTTHWHLIPRSVD